MAYTTLETDSTKNINGTNAAEGIITCLSDGMFCFVLRFSTIPFFVCIFFTP
jgi:hypothetical protein